MCRTSADKIDLHKFIEDVETTEEKNYNYVVQIQLNTITPLERNFESRV